MARAALPFYVHITHAARAVVGPNVERVAVLALKSILKIRGSVEVAHQQIQYRGQHLAFSSRVGRDGDLIVEMDLGNPNLARHLVLEDDLQSAQRLATERSREHRQVGFVKRRSW